MGSVSLEASLFSTFSIGVGSGWFCNFQRQRGPLMMLTSLGYTGTSSLRDFERLETAADLPVTMLPKLLLQIKQ
jgi:hypothetical protein